MEDGGEISAAAQRVADDTLSGDLCMLAIVSLLEAMEVDCTETCLPAFPCLPAFFARPHCVMIGMIMRARNRKHWKGAYLFRCARRPRERGAIGRQGSGEYGC